MTVGRPRATVAAMAPYRPGKSVAMAADEYGFDLEAVAESAKLSSNENPYPPVPSIVEAVAAGGTVVVSSHELERVATLSPRVVTLAGGQVLDGGGLG